jgi:hypothetical protein
MAVKRYDGSAWQTVAGLGSQGAAATSSSIATWVKTASGGETSLSGNDDNSQPLSYTVGQELLFINGVLQKRGVDYTATSGSSITGLSALTANDIATVWTVNAFSVTNAISNTLVDAKGDLVTATSADVPARLAVGANNTVLTADSSTATGLKWAAASSSATNWTLLNAGGTALTGATTITVSGLSAKQMLILVDAASAGSGDQFRIRFNSDSGANYTQFGMFMNPQTTYSNAVPSGVSAYSSQTSISLGNQANNAASTCDGAIFVDLTDQIGNHFFDMVSGINISTGSDPGHYITKGLYEGSVAITSVSIISSGSNFDAGTMYIWGAN